MVFTHIVNGDRAATLLDEALALPGNADRRDDTIVVLHDDLTVGPLRQIDDSAAARIGFWQKVLGAGERGISQTISDAFAINDNTLRKLVIDDAHEVVLWHTRHAADQLLLRRIAYRLRTMPQRINEMAIPVDHPIGELPEHGSHGSSNENENPPDDVARDSEIIAAAHAAALTRVNTGLRAIAPISILRISRLALEWQELKSLDNEVRRWRDNTFISGTFAEIDAVILEEAGVAWTPYLEVAARVRRHACFSASDAIVGWRCRELAVNGRLALDDDPVLVKATRVRRCV
ncbi:DUF3658 domain-containing protein [Robbsia sp. KACC 23696]|uniref:DUF1835 domain-containing protein n=1 Tax=Robbsia sp. KACC 23696 TaxID=3149231 RepID=UPI00325BE2CE